jgi:hypothetical protein
MPEATVQARRELSRLRADLVARLGDTKRRIISILDRPFPEFAARFNDAWGQAAPPVLTT